MRFGREVVVDALEEEDERVDMLWGLSAFAAGESAGRCNAGGATNLGSTNPIAGDAARATRRAES